MLRRPWAVGARAPAIAAGKHIHIENTTAHGWRRRWPSSPEAPYATKRAVNRVADAGGFCTALYTGLDVIGPLYATATEHSSYDMQFREIARTEGVPAAVRWRSAQFKA